ncbi:MAG: hypothetical protein Q7U28_08040 [Aquabacterium sp.]|nr:hypothetical protein [Aquabacterium sp.]
MKERPALFNGQMVRSLLGDIKTHTRRIAKLTSAGHVKEVGGNRRWHPADPNAVLACPYGQPGDRLWVRETWRTDKGYDNCAPRTIDSGASLFMLADQYSHRINHRSECGPMEWGKTRVSIHMPRWASRITLEIVSVRLERLQDISEADAIAEGLYRFEYGGQVSWRDYSLSDEWAAVSPMLESPIDSYRSLWESINSPGSWAANPLVWVIEFKRVEPGANK